MTITMPKILIASWIAVALFVIGPGRIDGALFPAAAPAEVSVVQQDPTDPTWVLIDGSSARLLAQCDPEYLIWRMGERDGRSVPVEYDWGPPEVKTEGAFEFYRWRVQAAPEDVFRNGSFADVMHQCHFKLGSVKVLYPWLTRSRFWN